ncbi:hypothetical protein GEV33_012223 [Tenebrio molitor]|uniref:Uncharacterized protein n=1 Tax=Tenebrio molitor TaxID=7067 RepID=A0A8J6H9N7_TENMO|nr:hypothetical protein GEV33_012223 [Tenebrio molitor]
MVTGDEVLCKGSSRQPYTSGISSRFGLNSPSLEEFLNVCGGLLEAASTLRISLRKIISVCGRGFGRGNPGGFFLEELPLVYGYLYTFLLLNRRCTYGSLPEFHVPPTSPTSKQYGCALAIRRSRRALAVGALARTRSSTCTCLLRFKFYSKYARKGSFCEKLHAGRNEAVRFWGLKRAKDVVGFEKEGCSGKLSIVSTRSRPTAEEGKELQSPSGRRDAVGRDRMKNAQGH